MKKHLFTYLFKIFAFAILTLVVSCSKTDFEDADIPDNVQKIQSIYETQYGFINLPITDYFLQTKKQNDFGFENNDIKPKWQQTRIYEYYDRTIYATPVKMKEDIFYTLVLKIKSNGKDLSKKSLPIYQLITTVYKDNGITEFTLVTAISDSHFNGKMEFPLRDFSGVCIKSELSGKPITGLRYAHGYVVNELFFDSKNIPTDLVDKNIELGIGVEKATKSMTNYYIDPIECVHCRKTYYLYYFYEGSTVEPPMPDQDDTVERPYFECDDCGGGWTGGISGEYSDPNVFGSLAWQKRAHSKMSTKILTGILGEEDLNNFIIGNHYTDSKSFQDQEYSYMHAMTEPGDTKSMTRDKMRGYFIGNVATYCNEFDLDRSNAFQKLGMAIHPIQDAYSPIHELRPWREGIDYVKHAIEFTDLFPNRASMAEAATLEIFHAIDNIRQKGLDPVSIGVVFDNWFSNYLKQVNITL